MNVLVTEKRRSEPRSRLHGSLIRQSRESEKRGLRLRPLIGVIKFMTNGKERVVIRVGRVIAAGGDGGLCVICVSKSLLAGILLSSTFSMKLDYFMCSFPYQETKRGRRLHLLINYFSLMNLVCNYVYTNLYPI